MAATLAAAADALERRLKGERPPLGGFLPSLFNVQAVVEGGLAALKPRGVRGAPGGDARAPVPAAAPSQHAAGVKRGREEEGGQQQQRQQQQQGDEQRRGGGQERARAPAGWRR